MNNPTTQCKKTLNTNTPALDTNLNASANSTNLTGQGLEGTKPDERSQLESTKPSTSDIKHYTGDKIESTIGDVPGKSDIKHPTGNGPSESDVKEYIESQTEYVRVKPSLNKG